MFFFSFLLMPVLLTFVLFILSTVLYSYCAVYHFSFLTYAVVDAFIKNRWMQHQNKLKFVNPTDTMHSQNSVQCKHTELTRSLFNIPITVHHSSYNLAKEIRAKRDIRCFVLLNKSLSSELSFTSCFLFVCVYQGILLLQFYSHSCQAAPTQA